MTKKMFPALLVLVSVLVGIFFRFYPHLLPFADLVVRQEVHQEEWTALKKGLAEKYPDTAVAQDPKLLERLFQERLKSARPEIDAKIAQRAREFKDRYRDPEGHVYMSGIDSYYWLRLLQNLINTGHIGDHWIGNLEFDDLIGNQIDGATKKNAHLWLGLFFYKTARFFVRDIALQEVLFYVPIFLSVLIGIFSFVVAKRLGSGDLGAFLASFTVNLSPFLLMRSVHEWFDTDIYNVLLPLLVFTSFLVAFQSQARLKRWGFSLLSAVFLSCYASTWKGWWFIFDIMIISGLLFVFNQRLSREEAERPFVPATPLLTLGIFFSLSTVLVVALNGFSVWQDLFLEPLRLLSVLKVTQQSVWPNVYQTVAELGKVEPYAVVTNLGVPFVFFTALVGILFISLKEHGIRDERYGFGILCLTFWIISVFYASLTAMRFVLLLVVPVGVAFGLTLDRLYQGVTKASERYLRKNVAFVVRYGVILIFSLYCLSSVMRNHKALLYVVPEMNDQWHLALTKIKQDTPKEAFIDSWWDFGHWFKAVSQRRVLFDGMTQNTPYAYWIANALLTSNEEDSVAILKMINTHNNKAADILEQDEKLPAYKAVRMIRTALNKDKEAARLYLQGQGIADFRVQELVDILFPRRLPPVYFIVSYDMITKIGPISYIGNWDFERVDMWFKRNTMSSRDFADYLMRSYGYAREAAEAKLVEMAMVRQENVNKWFSQPLGFYSSLEPGKEDEKIIYFDNGLVVNLANNHAFVASDIPARKGVPKSLIWLERGALEVVAQKDPTLSYSALLVKEKEGTKSLLLDEAFARSMLVRLYFFKGEGLKHFRLFSENKDDKGNAIYVYEVVW